VIRSSQAREDKEAKFRARIRDGATTVELMGLEETLRRLNLD
jgi:4-hydroxy-4-methyl-2-oxoglutarate aldolase